MNNTWTQEQTLDSVNRQRKALYVVLPIFFIFVAGLYYLFTSVYQAETQLLIQMGYLGENFTKGELSDFCLTYYNDLWYEDLTIACFWSL
jgi:capsular polysaccharide biosynthesis protein